MYHRLRSQGFSLLEITIAITIIALLIAAVSSVGNIQEKVDYNTMVDDVNSIAEAVDTFYTDYGGYPGDLFNATGYFGSGVTNGDGDTVIGSADTLGSENRSFWDHLGNAGLLSGSYDGTSDEPGEGVMEAPFKNGGYYAFTTSNISTATLAIVIGKYHTGTLSNDTHLNGLLTPSMAKNYDLTYDDGDASTGNVIATEGDDFSAGDCHSGGSYETTNDSDACIIHVIIVE